LFQERTVNTHTDRESYSIRVEWNGIMFGCWLLFLYYAMIDVFP
jgi:hypothetical protein